MDDEADVTPAVIAAVERGAGAACAGCSARVCGHEVVMSWVLGFKGAARCLRCLAKGLAREVGELAASLRDHIDHRDCWRAGWRRADEVEGGRAGAVQACAAARGGEPRPFARAALAPTASAPPPAGPSGDPAAEWDAGDLGCGDLVLELRSRMLALAPGGILKLTARDPGAPVDLPAWCGLTGHALLRASPPTYLLRRRHD